MEATKTLGPKIELWAIMDLNVRSKPEATGDKLGSIKAGSSVKDMQILPDNPMWYYSESQKGFIASGDGKKEYWSAKQIKAPKKSSPPPSTQSPTTPPGGPGATGPAVPPPAAEAPASDNKMVLIVGGIAIAAMLFYMLSNRK